MSFFRLLKKSLPENRYERRAREKTELDMYLFHCESLFFENGIHHTMNDEHRIVFLIAIRLLYPWKERDKNCRRHQIWKYFDELYRFSAGEMQSYCDEHPIDGLFDVLVTLPKATGMGVLLVLDSLLYIDGKPTNERVLIVKAIMAIRR